MKFDILEKIADKAVENPEKIAIEFGQKRTTYRELVINSNVIANFLINNGATGSNIIVLMERGINLIETMIGVLKAGCTFVPLDSRYPIKRIIDIDSQINGEWAICDNLLVPKLISARSGRRLNILTLDNGITNHFDDNKEIKFHNIHTNRCIDEINLNKYKTDNSYIYFTSGSTGRPKGVIGKRESLNHLIKWEIEEFHINDNYKVSQLIAPTFGPFKRDVFVALCAGGTVCIPSNQDILLDGEKLLSWIKEYEINLLHMVPTMFQQLISAINDKSHLNSVKNIQLSGDVLRGKLVKSFFEKVGNNVQLVNIYGQTETSLAKLYYKIQESDIEKDVIPVGKPIPCTEVVVVDDNNKELKKSKDIGKIVIRSQFLSNGYFNDESLTEMNFIKIPNSKVVEYNTSDLGFINTNGELEIVGREDKQVKIRGMRVNLLEIENALLSHGNINECQVMTQVDRYQNIYVNAFCVCINKEMKPNIIREYLALLLPDYMIPAKIMVINKMPLLPNGKIDRVKLMNYPARIYEKDEQLNNQQQQLISIWKDVLDLENIKINDDFFHIGGHSLNASIIAARVRKEFNVSFSVRAMFDYPTIKKAAEYLENQELKKELQLESAPLKDFYYLSPSQKRIMVANFKNSNDVTFNLPNVFIFNGILNPKKTQQVFQTIINRHDIYVNAKYSTPSNQYPFL